MYCYEKIKKRKKVFVSDSVNMNSANGVNPDPSQPFKGTNVKTSAEINSLFSSENASVNVSDIVDAQGKLKPGYEFFDLNGDSKLDKYELNFFAKGDNVITEAEMTSSINALDMARDTKMRLDGNINKDDRTTIYRLYRAIDVMQRNIKNLPENVQKLYAEAIREVNFTGASGQLIGGFSEGKQIQILMQDPFSGRKYNDNEIASVIIHELTHYISSDNNKGYDVNALVQEVQAFYMEYKLAQNLHPMPYRFDAKQQSSIESNEEYRSFIDTMKRQNPKMSEKELAIKAFEEFHLKSYSENYKIDKSAIYTEEYMPLGDIFNDPLPKEEPQV